MEISRFAHYEGGPLYAGFLYTAEGSIELTHGRWALKLFGNWHLSGVTMFNTDIRLHVNGESVVLEPLTGDAGVYVAQSPFREAPVTSHGEFVPLPPPEDLMVDPDYERFTMWARQLGLLDRVEVEELPPDDDETWYPEDEGDIPLDLDPDVVEEEQPALPLVDQEPEPEQDLSADSAQESDEVPDEPPPDDGGETAT